MPEENVNSQVAFRSSRRGPCVAANGKDWLFQLQVTRFRAEGPIKTFDIPHPWVVVVRRTRGGCAADT